MKIRPQNYKDIPFAKAELMPFDLVQLKYQGRWARMAVGPNGKFVVNDLLGDIVSTGETNFKAHGVYIGEWMIGTEFAQQPARNGKFFLFDCWQQGPRDLETSGFFNRYQALISGLRYLPIWCQPISVFAVKDAKTLWTSPAAQEFPGLIWRRATESVADTVHYSKRTTS